MLVASSITAIVEAPNILWISFEDYGSLLGVYGDTYADTRTWMELTRFRGHIQGSERKEESTMTRKQLRHRPDFRREIVGLVKKRR